ncbi:MAG: DUF6538 domain-containing protein [Pseudomonadota bacterium]|nr:DUF6538 domain-containing protein [Pseudomonadota bacterium]
MAKVSYIQRRGGIYYFRHPVPKYLKSLLGQGELMYSFKTYCYDDAKVKGLFLAQMAKRMFQVMSQSKMTISESDAKQIVREYFHHGLVRVNDVIEYERNLRDVEIHEFDELSRPTTMNKDQLTTTYK